MPAHTEVVTAHDGDAGLAVIMDDTAHYEVAVVGTSIVARLRLDTLRSTLGEAPRARTAPSSCASRPMSIRADPTR